MFSEKLRDKIYVLHLQGRRPPQELAGGWGDLCIECQALSRTIDSGGGHTQREYSHVHLEVAKSRGQAVKHVSRQEKIQVPWSSGGSASG